MRIQVGNPSWCQPRRGYSKQSKRRCRHGVAQRRRAGFRAVVPSGLRSGSRQERARCPVIWAEVPVRYKNVPYCTGTATRNYGAVPARYSSK